MPVIGGVAAAAAAGVAVTAARFGGCAGFAGMTVVLGLAFFVFGTFINARMNPEYREMAEFCRRVSQKVPAGETLYVPAPAGAEGFYHFYLGRAMPLRNGQAGLYLASQPQHDELRKAGKPVEVLETMLDHRGRGRYLLRITP
jgi:hypothetical protein